MRTITVPAGGATLSFWVTRDTEPTWDFLFVEAHTVGADDWTTLPDAQRPHEHRRRQLVPARELDEAPPVPHPLPDRQRRRHAARRRARPASWSAATGSSDGAEQWNDRSRRPTPASRSSSRSPTPATTSSRPTASSSTTSTSRRARATTSFEDDGDTLDGWTVPGAPAGSPGNTNDFDGRHGRRPAGELRPPSPSARSRASPRSSRSSSDNFGPYPFRDVGGIVDHLGGVGFALENQTRPVYAQEFFYDQVGADSVVVHELAHQWYGDSVSVHFWQDIWLNEGFATYAEWLWSEHEGARHAAGDLRRDLREHPGRRPVLAARDRRPGAGPPVRRAHLRARRHDAARAAADAVGDDAFFRILRKWASSTRGGNGTTPSSSSWPSASPARISARSSTPGCSRRPSRTRPPGGGAALTSQAATSAFSGGRTAHAALHASHARSLRR